MANALFVGDQIVPEQERDALCAKALCEELRDLGVLAHQQPRLHLEHGLIVLDRDIRLAEAALNRGQEIVQIERTAARLRDSVPLPGLHHEPLRELVDPRPVNGQPQVVSVTRAIEDQFSLPRCICRQRDEQALAVSHRAEPLMSDESRSPDLPPIPTRALSSSS